MGEFPPPSIVVHPCPCAGVLGTCNPFLWTLMNVDPILWWRPRCNSSTRPLNRYASFGVSMCMPYGIVVVRICFNTPSDGQPLMVVSGTTLTKVTGWLEWMCLAWFVLRFHRGCNGVFNLWQGYVPIGFLCLGLLTHPFDSWNIVASCWGGLE